MEFDQITGIFGVIIALIGFIMLLPSWWWSSRLPLGKNFSVLWKKFQDEGPDPVEAARKAILSSQKEYFRTLQKVGIILIIIGFMVQIITTLVK